MRIPFYKQVRAGIVGYPNVGKSSLINRLLKRRMCAAAPRPGVTRELKYKLLLWLLRHAYKLQLRLGKMKPHFNEVDILNSSIYFSSYVTFLYLFKVGSFWERSWIARLSWHTPYADQWSNGSNKTCYLWWHWREILRCCWCCCSTGPDAFKASISRYVSHFFFSSIY